MTRTEHGPEEDQRGFLGPRLVAGFVIGLGILLFVSALGIARGGGYSVVGPATIPLAVSVCLLAIGVIFGLRTTLRPDLDLAEASAAEERATHWPTVGLVTAALLVYAMALDGIRVGDTRIPGLGYLVSTAIFLPITARLLGSRSPVRDIIVGVVAASVLYFAFTEFLSVHLPPGLLDLVL